MKRTFFVAIMVFLILSLTGCGHDHNNSPQIIRTSILSDPAFDGDISLDNALTYTITQGNTQSVFAGIDPVTFTEYRSFLDFPLASVPGSAFIDSAFLDIMINSIDPNPLIGTIPIRIDLVFIQSPILAQSDYDRTSQPALATITIEPPISQSDFGQHVSVDVTSLMTKAQDLGLSNFQIRILEDLVVPVTPGLIEINDTTGAFRSDLAPLLQVNYF